jgi:hypothetical protein
MDAETACALLGRALGTILIEQHTCVGPEDAAWADRHQDFRYLVFAHDDEEMLDGALEVYEPAVGRRHLLFDR